jgi:hypothetical protein
MALDPITLSVRRVVRSVADKRNAQSAQPGAVARCLKLEGEGARRYRHALVWRAVTYGEWRRPEKDGSPGRRKGCYRKKAMKEG